MDSPRLATLRILSGVFALSLAAAGLAGPCSAQGQRDGSTQSDAGYRGPFLSWAGKTAAGAPTPAPAQPAPSPAPAPAPPQVAAEPLPAPIAAAPAPAAFTVDDRQAPTAQSAPPPSQPPVRLAQAAPPPAPAATSSAPVSARYYSLHRQYGITPDPDPTPTERPMVLIGPPDNPPAQSPSADGAASDGQDGADDADASAHHPNGQDPS